jgi:hypothetical protein
LTRIFGAKKSEKKGKKTAAKKVKAKPLTPLARSISEIQQMAKIGQRDPERLAQLLITMLGKERAKEDGRQGALQSASVGHRAQGRAARGGTARGE